MNASHYLDEHTASLKKVHWWRSKELQTNAQIVCWGNYGRPLLLFPTAGGDAEEVERFYIIRQLAPFIREGRLKVYSVDSINGRTWMQEPSVAHRVWIQQQFDLFIRNEVVPQIRSDCHSEGIELLTAGASVGAYNALVSLCRNPDLFCRAICMSGTYDIEKWLEGEWYDEFHHQSPLLFVPGLEGAHLEKLRERHVLLACGGGENEDPEESWRVAEVLGGKGIPNRVDVWDASWPHDWPTWREMLPRYVQEALEALGG